MPSHLRYDSAKNVVENALPPPQDLVVTPVAGNSVKLTWRRPEEIAEFTSCLYRLYYRELGSKIWELLPQKHPDELQYYTPQLAPLVSYEFKVQSYSNLQPNGDEAVITFKSGEAPPSTAPRNLREIARDIFSISIAWDAPETPNGTITGYTLCTEKEGSTEPHKEWKLPPGPRQFDHINLDGGTPYRFQIYAENGAGESPPSALLIIVTDDSPSKRRGEPKSFKSVLQSSNFIRKTEIEPEPMPEPEPVSIPKPVWRPPPKKEEVEQASAPIGPKTNPDAFGAASKARQEKKERERAKIEADRKAELAAATFASREQPVTGGQLSAGTSQPALFSDAAVRAQTRDFWSKELDPTFEGSEVVDDLADQLRLLRAGRELRSSTGDVRGRKNSVRSALGQYNANDKVTPGLDERLYHAEKNKTVVLYVTSLEAVRTTFNNCTAMLKLFENLMLKVQVKDVHYEPSYFQELAERLMLLQKPNADGSMPPPPQVVLPQLFINGVHVGGLDKVRQMNDCGELKQATAGFDQRTKIVCGTCGGCGFVPCAWCQGSNRSTTNNFIKDRNVHGSGQYLKCTICNKNGLQECPAC